MRLFFNYLFMKKLFYLFISCALIFIGCSEDKILSSESKEDIKSTAIFSQSGILIFNSLTDLENKIIKPSIIDIYDGEVKVTDYEIFETVNQVALIIEYIKSDGEYSNIMYVKEY